MTPSEFRDVIKNTTTPLPGSYPKSFTYKLSVKKKFEGLSILDFYRKIVPRSTSENWINKINTNNLLVNNKPITPNYLVKGGDITTHTSEPKTEPVINNDIKLIYLDDVILGVNKPSPLPVHASGRFVRNTLISILEKVFPHENLKLLHRIDANTTGVLVVAKNKVAAKLIHQQFKNKTIKKEYVALVEGIIKEDDLTLKQGIGKEILIAGARKIDPNGKQALTEIRIINRFPEKNKTLIKIMPLTGRTNQIRLHLAAIKHPIVGDIGYKEEAYFKNNPFTYSKDQLFLHANKISFSHPTKKKIITIEAELPKKYNDYL